MLSLLKKNLFEEKEESKLKVLRPMPARQLFPYQREGVNWLESRGGNGMLAFEMGLGKTASSLRWADEHNDSYPLLVICPASLKYNWEREAKLWCPGVKTHIISGTKPYILPPTNIAIINYDIVCKWESELIQCGFKSLVMDESHCVKNRKAKRTKACWRIASGIKHKILLTGTPILSRPEDLWTQIAFINGRMFPSFWNYAKRYCAMKQTRFGTDTPGASHTDELNAKLNGNVFIRKLKKEVLKDLPDKIHTIIPFDIDNNAEYKAAEKGFADWCRGGKARIQSEGLAKVEYARQAAAKGKMKGVISWIENTLEDVDKLVVFAVHKAIIDELKKAFPACSVSITGETPSNKRQEIVDQFQTNPKVKLIIGNVKAAGVGLNMTAASTVAFVEVPWTPGEVNQCADRCHRIGAKNCVNVYFLMSKNTIEGHMLDIIKGKQKVCDSILDGVHEQQESVLKMLIKIFTGEK